MADWAWTKEAVGPADILDAVKTIEANRVQITMKLDRAWTPARRYLEWAYSALQRGGEDGWDTASSLAKRAVCRRMDGILVNNHLGCFLGKNNEKKAEYLAQLRLPGLTLLRDLVIDPRNDIEHAYELATENQATHACEAADLFLRSTKEQDELPAVVSLGWPFHMQFQDWISLETRTQMVTADLQRSHNPTILITGYPDAAEVMILLPQEETLRTCLLQKFTSEQALNLNARFRQEAASLKGGTWMVTADAIAGLKAHLKL